MNSTLRNARPLLAGALALAVLGTSGCGWFKTHNDYARSVENRPLEVPPDLDMPETSNQLPLPASASLGASAQAPAGFVIAESPEGLWPRLGVALQSIDGVSITGSAQSLGSYDVSYGGQSFLVRIENTAGQSRVSAISPSGQVLRAGPASVLLDMVKGKL
jgi:uncharacterized lipoprotein